MKKKILFVVNPISGTLDKGAIPSLVEKYLNKDLFDYDIRFTEYAGHASEMAKQAADDGYAIVTAVGGDGTVNEVGRSLVHTDTALAIIPSGSGNGLARHLLLPMSARKCIEIINEDQTRPLDYGVINDLPFFCTCGMGFDAFVSMKFAEAGKRGPITYVQKVLEEGLKYRPETYVITDDSGTEHYKAFLVSVANASQYGNNAYIAPQASMSDGLLDVVIMEPFDILEAPQISIEMFNKTLNKNSKNKTFRTKHIHVHRSSAGVIHYDGEPMMSGADIDVHLEEKGINILINPFTNRSRRQPNLLQNTAADLFTQLSNIREDIRKQTRRGVRWTKMIQKQIEKNLPV